MRSFGIGILLAEKWEKIFEPITSGQLFQIGPPAGLHDRIVVASRHEKLGCGAGMTQAVENNLLGIHIRVVHFRQDLTKTTIVLKQPKSDDTIRDVDVPQSVLNALLVLKDFANTAFLPAILSANKFIPY